MSILWFCEKLPIPFTLIQRDAKSNILKECFVSPIFSNTNKSLNIQKFTILSLNLTLIIKVLVDDNLNLDSIWMNGGNPSNEISLILGTSLTQLPHERNSRTEKNISYLSWKFQTDTQGRTALANTNHNCYQQVPKSSPKKWQEG